LQRIFIETEIFTKLVEGSGRRKLLEDIQRAVLLDVSLPIQDRDLIKGSGGFAKLRVADNRNNKGKSGGYRIIYFDLPALQTVFLFLLYPKSVKETLSLEQVAALKIASQELKKWQPSKKRQK
jgi:hypothetical protein